MIKNLGKRIKDLLSLPRTLGEMLEQNQALSSRLKRLGEELKALQCQLLLKEMNHDLIRNIAVFPEFDRDSAADFYNRFAWHNPAARLIRARTAEIISDVVAHNKYLPYARKRELCQENFYRAENTSYEERAFDALVTGMAASFNDRLPVEQIIASIGGAMNEKKYWKDYLWRPWLLYCNLLLESGDPGEAERLLRKWSDSFGSERFYRILPLAHFARALGFSNQTIKKSAFIWESILKREESFAELAAKRTVAAVGNGPQEIGLNQGEEIDAHEVVIRFNNYTVSESTVRDYGRKTTIHAVNLRGFGPAADTELKYFFHIDDLSREAWTDERELKLMYAASERGGVWFHYGEVLADFFMPLQEKITRETGLVMNLPTLGYKVALPLIAMKPDFTMRDIFGFTCRSAEPYKDKFWSHYNPHDSQNTLESDRSTRHNIEAERRMLRWILLGEKA